MLYDFPMRRMNVDGNTHPDMLTEDGLKFVHIEYIESWVADCSIHLFYDPKEQVALPTYDWT